MELGRQNLNMIKVDPTMKDLLDEHARSILLDFNCHAVGTIEEFDPGDEKKAPRAKVSINYKKTRLISSSGLNGAEVFTPKYDDYPLMVDVPIYIMNGGGIKLTFPIKPGDLCSVLFNDRDIDRWFTTGQVVGCATSRLHSFSDGIALVGLYCDANAFSGYDGEHAMLSAGDPETGPKLGIGQEKVLIKNGDKTLNDILQDLITKLQSLTTTPAVSGSPCELSVTSIADLASVASDLEALLE